LDKHCSRCHQTKPLSDFSKQASSKDGHKAWCKACCSVYKAEWSVKNADHVRAYSAQYGESHRLEIREKSIARYHRVYKHDAAYCEERRKRCAEWKALHPDANREYVRANRIYLNAKNRERRRNDPERKHLRWVRESFKRRFAANPEKFRLQGRERASRRRTMVRAQTTERVDYQFILQRDGRICHLCGGAISERRGELHFDHVVPISKGGAHSTSNIRPSHRWCNQSKGNRGTVPSVLKATASSGADPITHDPVK
jgi:5-methylcytosine-specific restriction endonuclease McrA